MATQTASQRVAGKLQELGVTQGKLARILATTQQAISRRYTGLAPFTIEQLDAIADSLGIDPGDLVTRRQQQDQAGLS